MIIDSLAKFMLMATEVVFSSLLASTVHNIAGHFRGWVYEACMHLPCVYYCFHTLSYQNVSGCFL